VRRCDGCGSPIRWWSILAYQFNDGTWVHGNACADMSIEADCKRLLRSFREILVLVKGWR